LAVPEAGIDLSWWQMRWRGNYGVPVLTLTLCIET
jgi:hypothetical protein